MQYFYYLHNLLISKKVYLLCHSIYQNLGIILATCFFKFLFKRFYLYRGKGRGKERERNITVWLPLMDPLLGTWPATQACGLDWESTSNPLVCRPVLNPLSHTSQGSMFIWTCIIYQALGQAPKQDSWSKSKLANVTELGCGEVWNLNQNMDSTIQILTSKLYFPTCIYFSVQLNSDSFLILTSF